MFEIIFILSMYLYDGSICTNISLSLFSFSLIAERKHWIWDQASGLSGPCRFQLVMKLINYNKTSAFNCCVWSFVPWIVYNYTCFCNSEMYILFSFKSYWDGYISNDVDYKRRLHELLAHRITHMGLTLRLVCGVLWNFMNEERLMYNNYQEISRNCVLRNLIIRLFNL